MSDLEPITRREVFLNAIAEGGGEVPEPVTREEVYLKAILDNGGGGGGGDVTGVKGSAESSYRKGNVNIDPEDLGLGTASMKDVPTSGDAGSQEVVLGNDSRLTDARNAADVQEWAKAETKPAYTATEVGAIPTTDKGAVNGVATLTEAGKVPEGQLPSYVDDVIEGYLYEEHFYADAQHTEEITGEVGKIYVDLTTNRCYRWSGSVFVEIGDNRTFTANRVLVSDASGLPSASNVTDTEIGYLSGVTGAIQTQINGKQNTLTFDSTPTAQSNNPVTSGGIKSYVDGQGAKTVSGNPITITDAEEMNADHVVATITPTQTGSGTPSPSNVRPFTGFSEITIEDSKKNLLRNGKFSAGTQTVFIGGESGQSLHETYLKAGTYTLSVYMASGFSGNPSLYCCERNGSSNITIANGATQGTFSIVDDGYYRFWLVKSGGLSPSDIDHFQLEVGDQATTYESYQGQTYTVQLGDTYYQGEIDLIDGKIKCNYWSALINDLNCVRDGTLGRFWIRSSDLSNIIVKATSVSDVVDVRCEVYEKEASGSIWGGMTGIGVTTEGDLWLSCPSNITTVEDYKAQYGSYRILYPLVNPIEIQLTPQQIALLENNNTITTNVSSLDITYQTNNGIGDTASALDKRVTSLESKVPQPPTTDGTYKLTVTVASGEPTYSWESAT